MLEQVVGGKDQRAWDESLTAWGTTEPTYTETCQTEVWKLHPGSDGGGVMSQEQGWGQAWHCMHSPAKSFSSLLS